MYASDWDKAGAVLLVLWAVVMWAAVYGLWQANRNRAAPWQYRTSVVVIVLGVLGQIGHFQEHVAQAGYWVVHPESPPWMTPWGMGLSMGFGELNTAKPTLGMEVLHLTGNFIFLAGLAGMMVLTRRALGTKTRKWALMGVWMQGIHGLEHLSLTLSVALGAKRAIGLSTWFGLMAPGPGLWTYRVWWHFIANALGTTIFAIALFHMWRERRAIRLSYETGVPVVEPDPAPVLVG